MKKEKPFHISIIKNGIQRRLSPEDIWKECERALRCIAKFRGFSREGFDFLMGEIKDDYDPVELPPEVLEGLEGLDKKFPLEEVE